MYSKFRQIISGATSFDTSQHTFSDNNIQLQLDVLIRKCWYLYSVSDLVSYSKEEQKCEGHFKLIVFEIILFERFVVKLPIKDFTSRLCDTEELAM